MADAISAILINELDNVAVAVKKFNPGEVAVFRSGGEAIKVGVISNIPIYHKIAIKDFAVGDNVIKYGQEIGIVTVPIKKGEHVHLQNIRGLGDNTENTHS